MQALVGADRDRAVDLGEQLILARREGLLDQADARCCASREVVVDRLRAPRLVGIDDQA
ncbi:hypothetical protein J2W76_001806 [Methylorubrum zatmanii]|nr:hypothetical protein [Methylorubrum zatmanii]